MPSVRASRDHHLFDGYPGLIAVFRALQSLLMPSHPPCALSRLTTRIECSRTSTFSDALSPGHRIAWPTASLRSRRLSPVLRFFLALIQGTPAAAEATDVVPEPWENASREPLETAPLRHSFQDANYHDQIVNERNGTAVTMPKPADRREPIPGKQGSAATDPQP